jgi:hypothetical protein
LAFQLQRNHVIMLLAAMHRAGRVELGLHALVRAQRHKACKPAARSMVARNANHAHFAGGGLDVGLYGSWLRPAV